MARKKKNNNNYFQKWAAMFQVPWLMEYQGKGITRLVGLLFGMMIVLIFLNNHVERKRNYLNQTKNQVERLRSQYLRAHSEYERQASPMLVQEKTKGLGYKKIEEPIKVVEYYPANYNNKDLNE